MKSNSQIKKAAKAALSGNWFGSVCAFLLFFILVGLLEGSGIGALFAGVVIVGYAIFCLELVKTKKAKLGALFGGIFKNFFKKWGASFLVGLFTLLWSFLFIIPGFIKSYSYSMTYYILQEKPDMGVCDAITKSRQMMDGHKWQLFCLDLSFIGWMLFGIVTLGVGFVYVWPYYSTARAAFYKELKKASKKDS